MFTFGVSPVMFTFGVSPAMSTFGVSPVTFTFGVSPVMFTFGVSPVMFTFGVSPVMFTFGVSHVFFTHQSDRTKYKGIIILVLIMKGACARQPMGINPRDTWQPSPMNPNSRLVVVMTK